MTSRIHCAHVKAMQQISEACAISKQALEATGNLQSNGIRNVAALTATNSSSTNSIPSLSSGSIATELAQLITHMEQQRVYCILRNKTKRNGTKRNEE